MTDLNELADRVEVATGADRGFDFEILCQVDPRALKTGPLHGDPKFTSSIDAAMTLADGFVLLHLSDIGADGLPLCRLGNPSTTPARQCVGIAHTLPRAICAAALRARAATPVQVNEVVGS